MDIDKKTEVDIQRRISRLLKDMGVSGPPLSLNDVLDHLSVDSAYYDLDEPGLAREIWHRLRIGSSKAAALIRKVDLKAIWLPDHRRILLDNSVEVPRRKWVTAHEIAHSLIPSHKEFFLGDTAETLDPDYHEMLEAEANYAASELIFMGGKFTYDGLDCRPNFESVQLLKRAYKNSVATTLRRFVMHTHHIPMLGVISRPSWSEPLEYGKSRCRHFIPSPKFDAEFSTICPDDILSIIDSYTVERRGGPVGNEVISLKDDCEAFHSFRCESFFNGYDILTLMVHMKRH